MNLLALHAEEIESVLRGEAVALVEGLAIMEGGPA